MGLFLFSSCKEDVPKPGELFALDYPLQPIILKMNVVYFRNEFRSGY
jgi:hypothetical protein